MAGSYLGLQPSAAGQQNCWVQFPPGGGSADVNITTPWADTGDYTAADNPSYFTDVVTVGNAEVPAGTYLGWCLDFIDDIDFGPEDYTTLMYSSCDTNLDAELHALGLGYPGTVYISPQVWNEINYILNNKNGAYFYDIQFAIWTLIGGPPQDYAAEPPYPSVDTNEVNALLSTAASNAPTWQLECGDVIGIIVAEIGGDYNPVQLTMLELPYPCVPCLTVTKQVACLQPTNDCSGFTNVAAGYAGVSCSGSGFNQPAFCYQISLTNCGTIPLTNLVVSDNLLGLLSTNFFTNEAQVLPPGAGATAVVSMSFATNSTNTVTVSGDVVLASPIITNLDGSMVTNGEGVAASSSAVALVDPASIICGLSLYSPLNLDSNGNGSVVILPSATYYSASNTVTLSIGITNTGLSGLSGVTINLPALTNFNCSLPSPFNLAPGASQNFQLCLGMVSCPAQMNFDATITAQVVPDAAHCGVYDLTSTNLISVCSSCMGSVSCSTNTNCAGGTANLAGAVLLYCSTASDPGVTNVTVTLLGAASNTLATTTTDANGNFVFNNLAAGVYYVQVTLPTNYVETYPVGNSSGEVSVTIVPCGNPNNVFDVYFGYANTLAPTISVTPGGYLGCNPASLPAAADAATNVTATVSCGAASTNITYIDSTNGCLVTRTFTIVVTDTYGNSASNSSLTYTWTANSTPPVISGVPAGTNYGCNPASVPSSIAGLSASDSCGTASITQSSVIATNGCQATQIFTIVATDNCGNMATAYVTNTWTANTTAPMITGVPAGTNYGCNPASISWRIQGLGANSPCGTAMVNQSSSTTTNGCLVTQIVTIVASDNCGNTAYAYVTNTWTVNSTPPTLSGVPAGTNYGCNPASVPSTIPGLSASSACGTAGLSQSSSTTTNGCQVTQIFTIVAMDNCGNMATAYVTNTWTVNSTPPAISGVPAGTNYGCNPASVPSTIPGLSANSPCGTAGLTQSSTTSTNGCVVTRIFTIVATDNCGNMATAYVTNTWTVNSTPPAISGVPAGTNYGCNPASVPSTIPGLSASSPCGTAGLSQSSTTSTNGCVVTRIFTIVATDNCGNMATAYVTNTWTVNSTPPAISGVPAGTNYGCNPASVPSTIPGLSASSACGPAGLSQSSTTTTNGCVVTQIFTIVATDNCGNMATAYVTNTWTTDRTVLVLSGVPAGANLGCNPSSVPTVASVAAQVFSTNDTCSPATVHVTGGVPTTNGCLATQVFTIIATNACGNSATAFVTNTWTVNTTFPVLGGVPASRNLGCNPTNVPTLASVQAAVFSTNDTCSPATVIVTGGVPATNGCGVTQVFVIVATNACRNTATAYVTNTWTQLPTVLVTNLSYVTNTTIVTNTAYLTNTTITTNISIVTNITITTNCCTNSICGNFNWQNPGGGWLWCSANIGANPGQNCTINCQGGSVTLACNNGQSYTYPVPNGTINFSSTCTVATNWFDGTQWHTTLPCTGDNQIFAQGCAIPWQAAFANCQSVCWTIYFSSPTPGLACNWQWGAACFNNSLPGYGSIAPKACQQTSCPNGQYYSASDSAGTPENHKPYCVAGGTGYGGGNCTGSWQGPSTTCTFGTKTNITYTFVTNYTTNVSITTNVTVTPVTTVTTNTTVTTGIAPPVLSGVPAGTNFGCNPANVPTVASVQAEVTASETCSGASVQVTQTITTNICAVTQVFTITAMNSCGGSITAYVTNTWTADTTPPVISGVPTNTFLGCGITNLPSVSNLLAGITAIDPCGVVSLTVTYQDSTNGCQGSRTFTITATDPCGNTTTSNVTYSWIGYNPDLCTNSICQAFNTRNPGSGWVWFNAHVSGNPGQNCTLYCQNATITLNCGWGQSFTYPVPNAIVTFSTSCTVATNWFDGTNWNTIAPATGDAQIFLAGCAVPWQWAFAGCPNACWTGIFSCDTPGLAFQWQWGAACYANNQPSYGNMAPKACLQTPCPNGQYYNASDCAGTPENNKPYCVGGGTGSGGGNYTGGWSPLDTTCTFSAGTLLPPVLNGVPPSDNLGINPTNIPTLASVQAQVTASDTCSPAPVYVTMSLTTNSCMTTQIFTISATNLCGGYAIARVTNTWTTLSLTNHFTNMICTSFNGQNPGGGWLWLNCQLSGKPGNQEVFILCSNASVTLHCNNGQTYTYPVPNGQILFSPSCTAATNWFDGMNWTTTLPTGGDDQIFLSGCAIPWLPAFAGCQNVCWTGDFSCNVPGLSFNWQFGAACYNNALPSYNNLAPKACHQTPCPNGQYFDQSHYAGTPENHNPYCVGGGTGYGGSNWIGNLSNPGTCNF